jgi:hypothetical protein
MLVCVAGARPAVAAGPSPADPRVTTLAAEAHVPLSAAAQRISWQDAGMTAIPGIAGQLGSAFGGAWFDPATGRLTVGVVRQSHGPMAPGALASVTRAGLVGVTDVRAVQWSAATLDAVTAVLSPAIGRLNTGAVTGVTLRTIPPANVVEIVVGSGALSPAQRTFVAAAQRRFGSKVRIHRTAGNNLAALDSCSGTHCDPPLRGGVEIDANGIGCTLGFIVRSNSDQKLYAMTAGHCVADGGGASWTEEFVNGSRHVIGAGHSYHFGGNRDAGIITINNPSGWQPRAEVLVLASPNNGGIAGTGYDATYAISGTGGSAFGMRVCKAGAFHGTSCGQVIGLNVTGPSGITGMGEATYYGGHGDSGGSVFAGHIAYGLHESHDPPNTAASFDSFYVGITAAADSLNVHVATGT